jgi:hypothetical protein
MRTHFRLDKRSRYPWIFLTLALLVNAFVYVFLPEKNALELYLPVTVGIAGFTHFLYTQHYQDTQLFVNLFKDFNARYDRLNEQLNAIFENNSEELTIKDKKVLFDYFNLCAEEYLFYKSGYIDKDVWRSWLAGMEYYARKAAVRNLWELETKENSYYGFSLKLFDTVHFSPPVIASVGWPCGGHN